MTPSEFRFQFPDGDFDDRSLYPDTYVQRHLDLAAPKFNVARWGRFYSEGFACYVANAIVVGKTRASKGALQATNNLMTEKHVGPVGASFDPALLMMQAKNPDMATSYGQRYCELRDMVGKGGCTSP